MQYKLFMFDNSEEGVFFYLLVFMNNLNFYLNDQLIWRIDWITIECQTFGETWNKTYNYNANFKKLILSIIQMFCYVLISLSFDLFILFAYIKTNERQQIGLFKFYLYSSFFIFKLRLNQNCGFVKYCLWYYVICKLEKAKKFVLKII